MGLVVLIVVVGLLLTRWVWSKVDTGGGSDTWQLCQPAVAAQLPAGGYPDWSVGDASFADFSDGTHQATGTVKVSDVKFYYECQVKSGAVTDVVVTPQ